MTGAELGHDALRKRINAMGGLPARRAEAARALRGWKWLEELRFRFDFAIEILGVDIEYVFDPLPEHHVSAGLRAALRHLGEPAVREVVAGVIRTGRADVLAAPEFHVRLIPVFSRLPAPAVPLGVLVIGAAFTARARLVEDSVQQADRRLDSSGQWLVAAIEAELTATMKQGNEARELERTAGSFDIVDALTELQSDQAIIALLMDALALWYDADVHAYRQDLSGAFVLYASLPGADTERVAPQLLGHQLWGRDEVFSPESLGELQEFGWSAAMGHTVFVPILVDQSTEWLLAVSDVRDDPAIRHTLGVFRRVVGALLADVQHQTIDRLTRKLSALLLFGEAPFYATARMALEAVAIETGATSVQFAAFEVKDDHPVPSLALQWGGADTDVAPFVDAETTSLSANAIVVGVGAGSGITAVLSLKRQTGAFAPVVQRLARSAASTIGVWLSGSLLGSDDVSVPQTGQDGVELMQRLRHQVDSFGHVRVGGAVAVVLPKPQVSTGRTIDDAVGLIEHHVRPSDVIGTIGGSGAGVLLADATRDVASAVVGRLLQAARQQLVGVRVGVAMFAASTESPESVLERALMNARRGSAV